MNAGAISVNFQLTNHTGVLAVYFLSGEAFSSAGAPFGEITAAIFGSGFGILGVAATEPYFSTSMARASWKSPLSSSKPLGGASAGMWAPRRALPSSAFSALRNEASENWKARLAMRWAWSRVSATSRSGSMPVFWIERPAGV